MVSRRQTRLPSVVNTAFDVNTWLRHITKDRPYEDQQALAAACTLACLAHRFETRQSGEPYLLHVMTVADILADLGMGSEVIIAALLHDITDKTLITLQDIRNRFGKWVAGLVDGVNKMAVLEDMDNEQANQSGALDGRIRSMLKAMERDPRIVFIKLADRLDMMRNLGYLSHVEQKQIAGETLQFFAPLANRLGIWQIKWELEDLSLRCVEPEAYQAIAKKIAEKRVDREEYISSIVNDLKVGLKKRGIESDVTGRPKHIYSIWRKMQRKGVDFDKIFDVRAVRVLVDTEENCYRTLAVVHKKWESIQGEFDDYIAHPKPNDYRSIHTAVIGPGGKVFEVQIRTSEMHKQAELGIAAHWRYKEQSTQLADDFKNKIKLLERFLLHRTVHDEWQDDPPPLSIKDDKKNNIYVLTPKHQVIELPEGATPIDFAYAVHTSIGHRCRGALVNKQPKPLDYCLKRGEEVEIITMAEERPSRDWLIAEFGYIKTTRARERIRRWFRDLDNQQNIEAGQVLLERELKRLNVRGVNREELAKRLKYDESKDFLLALGRGEITLSQVSNALQDKVLAPPVKPFTLQKPQKNMGQILVSGVTGVATQTAGCCRPVPFEPVIGYVTSARGIMVHRSDCPVVLRWLGEENKRLVEVQWNLEGSLTRYPVNVDIQAYDRPGLLGDIGTIAAHEEINITRVNTRSSKQDGIAYMLCTFEVRNMEQLSRALEKIDRLPNVVKVQRVDHVSRRVRVK